MPAPDPSMEFESEIPPNGNPDSAKKQHALAAASIDLPGNIGGGGKRNTDGEPFWAKARSRIRAYLAKPIFAEGLNGACQENDPETRDE